MTCGAVVVAAGHGRRMGFNKTMADLAGRIVLFRVLDVLDEVAEISWIVVAASPEDLDALRQSLDRESYRCPVELCAGGETRPESVRNGVRVLPIEVDLVLIHDAARPLVTSELIRRGVNEACVCGGAIAAIPVTDTIKLVGADDQIELTVDRTHLYAAQTPQVFRRSWLDDAYHRFHDSAGWASYTDESSLLERAGYTIRIFPGSIENIKLTTPFDLALAQSILSRRERLVP